ncbi:MAG: hypothetical protein AB7K71_06170 [Polyangiaceae bacterium]
MARYWLGGVALLLCACGGASDEEASVDRARCEFTPSELGFDEHSPVGVSAASCLEGILGARECTWSWNDPGQLGARVPSPGETTASVELSYRGGSVVYLEGKRVGGSSLERLACPSSLEVTTTLRIETADGVLHREFELPLECASPGYAEASVDVQSEDLRGYAFEWAEAWPYTSRRLALLAEPSGVVSGLLREEAHHESVQTGETTSFDGVVFRSAEWWCLPE